MSDMKCPFCQQEMTRTNGTHNKVGVWQCQNSNDPDNVCIASGYLFNDDVLNYIIRTRKALEIAVAALTVIAEGLVIEHQVVGHEDDNKMFIAKHALEQINNKEEK